MSWPRQGHITRGRSVEVHLPWTTLVANEKEAKFIPAGDWSLLGEYLSVRGWGELAGCSGDIQVTPAVQLAADPRRPGAVVGTSTLFEREGVFDPGDRVRMGTLEKATYVRVGWLVASPSGEVVHASASGMVELGAEEAEDD